MSCSCSMSTEQEVPPFISSNYMLDDNLRLSHCLKILNPVWCKLVGVFGLNFAVRDVCVCGGHEVLETQINLNINNWFPTLSTL